MATITIGPLDAEWQVGCHARYDELRSSHPICRFPDGYWVLTRYDHVSRALTDRRFSNRPAPFALLHARNRDRYVAARVAANLIAFRDEADHAHSRRVLTQAFADALAECGDAFGRIADQLLSGFAAGEEFDGVADFAIPFSCLSIARFLGLPQEEAGLLKPWADAMFRLFHAAPDPSTFAAVNQDLSEFRDYMRAALDRGREDGGTGYVAIARRHAQGEMPDEELADNLMLIAADGIENVRAGLATCIMTLLGHPGQIGSVLESDARMRAAIVEALRLESPGQFQGRILIEEVEIDGTILPAHSLVLLAFASANRDPAAFPEPGRFHPDRTGPRPLTFGLGPHSCLGAHLVLRELSATLCSIFSGERIGTLRMGPPEWEARIGHRWLARLPLSGSGARG